MQRFLSAQRAYFGKAVAGALMALFSAATIALPAWSQQTAAPPPPAAAAPSPQKLSAEQIALARQLVIASGLSRTFGLFVPRILAGLEDRLTRTRPEIATDLHAVLLQIEPEFVVREREVIDEAAALVAAQMNEAELKDAVAFFTSESGKKYVDSEPVVLNGLTLVLKDWQEKIANDILARAHAEMKKKGKDF